MIKTKRFNLLLGLGFILFVSLNAYAQDDDSEIIRVDTRLVSVDVLVTDKRTGARIDELKRENFQIFDDGRLQTLTHFSKDSSAEQPLAIVLLVDTSTSMYQSKLTGIRAGIERAVKQLRAKDEMAVMTYSPGNKLVQELTGNRRLILDALAAIAEKQEPSKKRIKHTGEDMAAGFLAAQNHVRKRLPNARIALVVISDDENETPKETVTATVEQLLRGGGVVSGLLKLRGKISLGNPLSRAKELNSFSEQTGGEIVSVKDGDYSGALEQVIGDLAGSYSLGFVPDDKIQDGRFRKLTVKVSLPEKLGKGRKVEVKTRRGYFAPTQSQ